MPSSPRANAKQTDMPCSDLDVVEADTTMLTTLFDPTEWPPLLNLMDNTNAMSSDAVCGEKAEMKRKRDVESGAENVLQKRSKLENADSSEDEICSIEVKESPEQKERRLLEERRNILRISVCKMRTIEDPEMFLRRSVLIHNTIRRLQVDMGQENFVKFTQNFASEEMNAENDRTRSLVGFLEHQSRTNSEDQETSAKEYHNDLNDYSEYNDNSDEESDDDDEEDDDDDDLCVSKDFQDDRLLGTKEMNQEINPSTCMCYQDSWCRQDCVRGCAARREGNHCATEFRTTRNTNCQGESVFDSVVYQSLLVSLES